MDADRYEKGFGLASPPPVVYYSNLTRTPPSANPGKRMKTSKTAILALVAICIWLEPGYGQSDLLERQTTHFGKIERGSVDKTSRFGNRVGGPLSAPGQDDFDVLHYKLDLTIDPTAKRIDGTVTADLKALSPISTVVLDLSDSLTVTAVRDNGNPVVISHASDQLTIFLGRTTRVNEQFTIEVDYGGQPNGFNDELGLPAFEFGTHGGGQVAIQTLSEPSYARNWWPCKDVPGDKSTATLWITVPDTLIVASNGALVNTVDVGDGLRRFEWEETYQIAPYLVSLAISNYVVWSEYYNYTPVDSMEVQYYVYAEHDSAAQIAFSNTVPMMEYFSNTFGLYPFISEKYAMAEVGWGFAAMEHQTCTSYGTGLIRPNNGRDWIIAHELAHQWWGNMITPSDWRDVWLNEGFAVYCEALWEGEANGEQRYHKWMEILNFRPGFRGPVYDPDRLFGLTVYRKGAWVLHMLRRIMGDTNFFATLRDFASSSHAYGNATTADFQAFCEARHGESLDAFFQSFVYGTGRPAYELFWTQSPSGTDYRTDITIHQTQREGVFVMPVDIRFTIESADTTVDTTVVVANSRSVDTYVFYLPGRVVDIALDPDNWILKYTDTRTLSPDATLEAVNLKVYPNPFNPSTTITFETGVAGPVRVVVYDARGARIRGLMDSVTPPQFHEIVWDGRNDAGQGVASGVYFVRVETRQAVDVRKAILLK